MHPDGMLFLFDSYRMGLIKGKMTGINKYICDTLESEVDAPPVIRFLVLHPGSPGSHSIGSHGYHCFQYSCFGSKIFIF